MPRRALRKIDPAVDLSGYLKTLDQLPVPWDSVKLFGRSAPLEIEVGSGKGMFLSTAAARTPQHNFLGIELAAKYARFAAARLAQRKLSNSLIVHGDAAYLLGQVLPGNIAQAIHVYFPDPWWKKRHHKRRIMTAAFVQHVERTLGPGGTFHFWTDVETYFADSLQLIRAHTSLVGPVAVEEQPATHDLDYRTHFERRVRLGRGVVFRAMFEKLGSL
jgi:tRNA (guanine-N7-)-methyltransferase